MPAHIQILLIASIISLVSACSSSPTRLPEPKKIEKISAPQTSPEELIAQAFNANSSTERNRLLIAAATQYWDNNLQALAKSALVDVDTLTLTGTNLQTYIDYQLQISIAENDTRGLEQTLAILSPDLFEQADINTQKRMAQLSANAHELLGNNVQAAIILSEHAGFYDGDEYWALNEKVWRLLSRSETNEVAQFEYLGDNFDTQGWLSLATVIKQNRISLEQQYAALNNWLELWQTHPAKLQLPRELEILSTLPEKRPKNITLALPLSGALAEVGEAIRDGFLAAFYQSQEAASIDVQINFFDTNARALDELYLDDSDSPDLIIGPLDKASLNILGSFDEIKTPTLALNYLQEDLQSENLFQFGLAPEIEAAQAAEKLADLGFNRVGIITPNNDWGLRMSAAFTDTLTEKGKRVVKSSYYEDQKSLSKEVASLLATQESQTRARNLRRITGLQFEFVPRRRQDIDAIFMVANPEFARQLKPLFAFHYAGNLPVFSTSHIHDSYAERNKNQDLNRVYFTEIPWILSTANPVKNIIQLTSPELSKKYDRFFALGADTFNLAPRIELLKEVNDSRVDGYTGFLTMGENGRIIRELEWAKFEGGKATAIQLDKLRI